MTTSPTRELIILASGEQREVLVAWLESIGYEGFWEEDHALHAYIPTEEFDPGGLKVILDQMALPKEAVTIQDLVPQNWNQVWESNYPPVRVGDWCQIVTSFHEVLPGIAYTLHITPKMSFGTGHHATTRLMLQAIRGLNIEGSRVLDMGCGTGVLAILAARIGAASVVAIDIDPWSQENAIENKGINGCEHIEVLLGGKEVLPPKPFDVILANINRNVLLADMEAYVNHLLPGGTLLISGFHPEDLPLLHEEAARLGLLPQAQWQEGNWVARQFSLSPAT